MEIAIEVTFFSMAIVCPRCGREYDVTLFQFGRTIHCTCGARIGPEHRIGPASPPSETRFMVDAMLGGLARWLRILGYDTAYDASIADADLVRRGLEEGRHILTRDRALPEEWHVSECTILELDDTEAQLREVVRRFDLDADTQLFTRCTVCNSPLEPISPEQVRGRVPPRVWERQETYTYCPKCDRVYWPGSHTRRMRARLQEILGG